MTARSQSKSIRRRHVTLEARRDQLIKRLRTCRTIAEARALLAKADLGLMNARVAAHARDHFWQAVEERLTSLGEEARFLADRRAGVQLAARVAAAKARLTLYRESAQQGTSKRLGKARR